jgi:hypothetical protein
MGDGQILLKPRRNDSFKGRWQRKKRVVRKEAEIQHLSGIVAIEGYLQFERVVSL